LSIPKSWNFRSLW